MSTVRVNGEDRDVTAATVFDLLLAEEVDPQARFVAVALNGVVVPRGRWEREPLKDGDEIEIVTPAPGG